jgi:hypothetical protein
MTRLCKRIAIVCLAIVYGASCLALGYVLAEIAKVVL